MIDYETILKGYGQDYLYDYFKLLNESEKDAILEQLRDIDFEQMKELYQVSKDLEDNKLEKASMIEHIDFTDKNKIDDSEYWELDKIGYDIIHNNQYAVVTMAGGQGTRLGHDGPKGTFLLDVKPEPKYLFQIHAESLIKANKRYGITLNWYIMTSNENNSQTIEFFEKHNYFGYPKEYVKFFIQGDLPLLDKKGRLIIDENRKIKFASDGNGCIYKSMKQNGILDDMKKKGIKWVFIGGVDNVLLNMTDSVLLGLTVKEGNEIGNKSIVKAHPHERVGVFCKKNGVPTVIEYSELPKQMAEETDDFGELLYGESNIICHLYSIDALGKIADKKLPYHSASKKAKYMDVNGKVIEPEEPNAYKYEAFIFDGFNYFDDISLLRGSRQNDFAPIKNKEGADSPETAKKLYNAHLRALLS